MSMISRQDADRIRDAIRQAESKSSGELVTVIARQSDGYYYIPVMWAAMLALLIPNFVMLFGTAWLHEHLYFVQMLGFIACAALFSIRPIKHRLIPRHVRHQRAHLHAVEQFVRNNLSATSQRNGLLLFVSVAERYVEIIADKGINDRVAAGTWDGIVHNFTARVHGGEIGAGFIEAIGACGDILESHFPIQPGDKNELPDHLVIV